MYDLIDRALTNKSVQPSVILSIYPFFIIGDMYRL